MNRTALLRLPRDQVVGTSINAVRLYATATRGGGSGGKKTTAVKTKGGRPDSGNDSLTETMRKVMYESGPTDEERLAALAKVVPSKEVHETITRAWSVIQTRKRQQHEQEMRRKYDSMRKAIDLLEKVDKTLFDKAVGGKQFDNLDQTGRDNSRLRGLVPKELRPPMELPGTKMWDHDWKAPSAEASTGGAQTKAKR
ncbi:hypothetical protein OIV83_000046 [Microbotryomycetes sp. JL201]|nr:hypothetical protein OIV83_000046 [Microbotryomycetes sp. JL201]